MSAFACGLVTGIPSDVVQTFLDALTSLRSKYKGALRTCAKADYLIRLAELQATRLKMVRVLLHVICMNTHTS